MFRWLHAPHLLIYYAVAFPVTHCLVVDFVLRIVPFVHTRSACRYYRCDYRYIVDLFVDVTRCGALLLIVVHLFVRIAVYVVARYCLVCSKFLCGLLPF